MMSSSTKYGYFNVTTPKEWIAHVEINRADKLNAFLPQMWQELRMIFKKLSFDDSIRAIILSAAGDRAFSAGLDIQWAASDPDAFNPPESDPRDGARKATAIRRLALDFQDCISSIEQCEKPVICVLHGIAVGISIDISTCADIRICTSNVNFSVKEVDIGLAADVGTLTRLPKVVGHYGWVKEVSMTARHFGAEEAYRVGFVNHIAVDKDAAILKAMELASLLASKSPVAVQGTKNFLDYSRDHTVAEGLYYTAVWNAGMVQTKDVPAALEAAKSKKPPKFEKL